MLFAWVVELGYEIERETLANRLDSDHNLRIKLSPDYVQQTFDIHATACLCHALSTFTMQR